jgi:hypothetical protein
MLKETIELEKLRQRIAMLDWEAIDLAEQLKREKPSGKKLKSVEERRSQLAAEFKKLTTELTEMIAKGPREAVEEWVNWHKNELDEIIKSEPEDSSNTRLGMARFVLAGWEKVLTGEQVFIRINKYFLKEYIAKAEQTFPKDEVIAQKEVKKSSWKFWE